ncbi:MAG TPA: hypothetical protein P5295_14620 [Spirochaetota bacterium]|nr:hypothetical protein [Spirochaetota bacterium]
MKQLYRIMTILLLFCATALYAGGVEENSNQSAEWVKSLNRNASLDADATYFNPAGTAMMGKGLYLYVSYQCILQPITLESDFDDNLIPQNQQEFDASQNAYYFPNLYLVYNNWDMAFSLGLMAIGGGGGGSYPEGFPSVENTAAGLARFGTGSPVGTFINGFIPLSAAELAAANACGNITGNYDVDANLEASEAFYSFQLNYAYMPVKQFAFSVGYRFIYGYNTYKGKFVIDVEGDTGTYTLTEKIDSTQNGMSHGVIGGISIAPLAGMTDVGSLIIAGRFEWNSEFILKTKTKKNYIIPSVAEDYHDGHQSYRTLPMVVAVGANYSIMGIHLDAGLTYYFNKYAYWNGLEDDYDNGYEVGLGISYDVITKKNLCENLNIGVGYNYGTDGENDDTRSDTHIGLNWHAVSCGVTWESIPGLKLTLGYVISYFIPDEIPGSVEGLLPYSTEATKYTHDIAIGLQYKIL